MAHNPYHLAPTYDVNAQNNQPSNDYVKDDLGFDFSRTDENESNKYSSFFDPYNNQGEQFAGQANALQTAYSNDQQQFLTQGTQQNLTDLSMNTPNTGFSGSGAIERNVKNSREQIMRGYETGMAGIEFDRGNQEVNYQKDIYGMREDYKEDQRNTLLDLIQSDAKIDDYSTSYEGDRWGGGQEKTEQERRNNLPYPNPDNYSEGQTITQDGYEYTFSNGQWGTGRKVG